MKKQCNEKFVIPDPRTQTVRNGLIENMRDCDCATLVWHVISRLFVFNYYIDVFYSILFNLFSFISHEVNLFVVRM